MRTFIELSLDDNAKNLVQARQDELRGWMTKQDAPKCLRWTAASSVHLTLRFLGETTEQQQAVLAERLAFLAEQWHDLELTIDRLGCFPNIRHPNVVWLGIQGDADTLHDLQAEVDRLVQEVGFAADNGNFTPHLTIARTTRRCSRSELRRIGNLLKVFVAEESVKWPEYPFVASRLVHMRSDLQPDGAVYTPLSEHRLGVQT